MFFHGRAGLRSLGLYSRTLRAMLGKLGAGDRAQGERDGLQAFERARAAGAGAWPTP